MWTSEEESCAIPTHMSLEKGFLEMVHVALKSRGDLMAHPQYTMMRRNRVTESVLHLIIDGHSLFLPLPGKKLIRSISLAPELVYNLKG